MLERHRLELAELMEMLIQIPKAILMCWLVQRLHQIALFKTAPSRLYFWFRDLYTELQSLSSVGIPWDCSCSQRHSELSGNTSNRSKNLKRNRELLVNKWCSLATVIPKLQNSMLTANLPKISARYVGCCMKRVIKPDKIDVLFQTGHQIPSDFWKNIFFLQQSV